MRVVCEQHRDGIPDEHVTVIPALKREPAKATLERKLAGAEYRGWTVERTSETEFHVWKEYVDGDGTPDRPHRKDRYFRLEA
jgi:hypothetical protein